MAVILSGKEVKKYIEKAAREIACDIPELLDAYWQGMTTKERVVENVTREIETAIRVIDDSLGKVEELEDEWA